MVRSFAKNDCPWEKKMLKCSGKTPSKIQKQLGNNQQQIFRCLGNFGALDCITSVVGNILKKPVTLPTTSVSSPRDSSHLNFSELDKENEQHADLSLCLAYDVCQDTDTSTDEVEMVSKSHEHLQLEISMEYSQLLLNVGVYWKELKKKKKPFSGKGKRKMLAKRTQAANGFKKAMEADVHAKGRLIVEDVSEGLEPVALKAFCSTVTTMPVAHEEFTYMTKNSRDLRTKVEKGSLDLCCDCVDRCGENCACVIASMDNGHSFMTQRHFIFLIGPHDCDTSATFVCGPMCACRSDCSNRAPEQATSPRLELFRHNPILGMGVRTTKKLSIGEIAYEFTGRVCTKPINKFYAWTTHVADDKAVSKKKNGKDVKHLEGYELILSRIFKKSNLPDMVEDICIDPFDSGNIGRFVSSSEYPNVVPMKVFENDLRPQSVRLFFVAIREIFPEEEIFCDYGGYYKGFKTCLCRSPACKPARSHLLKFGKEKALETLLKFQHRKRHGGPDLTRLNFQGDQGELNCVLI